MDDLIRFKGQGHGKVSIWLQRHPRRRRSGVEVHLGFKIFRLSHSNTCAEYLNAWGRREFILQ